MRNIIIAELESLIAEAQAEIEQIDQERETNDGATSFTEQQRRDFAAASKEAYAKTLQLIRPAMARLRAASAQLEDAYRFLSDQEDRDGGVDAWADGGPGNKALRAVVSTQTFIDQTVGEAEPQTEADDQANTSGTPALIVVEVESDGRIGDVYSTFPATVALVYKEGGEDEHTVYDAIPLDAHNIEVLWADLFEWETVYEQLPVEVQALVSHPDSGE